jgi:OFA family oxalate/formate antiporter-like MFS transporter
MHYGWVIVAACLTVGLSGYGTYYSFTLFYPHLVAEFGWSRAAISGAMSLGLVTYGLFALPMGWCVDRFGPRWTIGLGGVLVGGGTFLGAFVSELWHLYALYGGITAIGMGVAWAPLVSTISRWFETRRGLALGIGLLGGGTGTVLVAPLADSLIAAHGWREAYLWLGAGTAALMVGGALLLRHEPSSMGLAPYGAGLAAARRTAAMAAAAGMPPLPVFNSLGAIVRTALFWRMATTFGFWWFAGAIVFVQLAPFVQEKGFDLSFAALVVAVFSGGNGIGKIAVGAVSDRIGGLRAYQLCCVFSGIALAGLGLADEAMAVLAAAFLFGFGFGGASPMLASVAVGLFGIGSAGALMGAVMALMGTIGAAGPLASGLIFDLTGSYRPAYLLGGGVLAASALMAATLRRRR